MMMLAGAGSIVRAMRQKNVEVDTRPNALISMGIILDNSLGEHAERQVAGNSLEIERETIEIGVIYAATWIGVPVFLSIVREDAIDYVEYTRGPWEDFLKAWERGFHDRRKLVVAYES